MRRLILLRHAKAVRAQNGDDFARPLAAQGRLDAALIGEVLAGQGLVPDLALVSSAQRTRETWDELAKAFPDAQAQFRRDLYLADARTLLAALEGEEAQTLMLVAHNPGVHALAVALLRDGSAAPSTIAKVERGFPTATAAVFAIDEAGRASYDGLFLAAEHGGAGAE